MPFDQLLQRHFSIAQQFYVIRDFKKKRKWLNVFRLGFQLKSILLNVNWQMIIRCLAIWSTVAVSLNFILRMIKNGKNAFKFKLSIVVHSIICNWTKCHLVHCHLINYFSITEVFSENGKNTIKCGPFY